MRFLLLLLALALLVYGGLRMFASFAAAGGVAVPIGYGGSRAP